jgi:hypothetical protein
MAVFAATTVHIAADDLFVAGFANQVELTATADELDVTTFAGAAGYRQKITGLATFNATVSGFQDFVAPGPDPSFPAPTRITSSAAVPFSVAVPGTAVGDPCYFGSCQQTNITPLQTTVGEVAGFSFDFSGTTALNRGVVLAERASRVATGSGTVRAFTTPVAGQSIYAIFHVHSVTGTGTITFTIQTDDSVGFGTPSTRITSSAFAAIGSQRTSVAGPFAGETHWRAGWTISGFTAVEFSIAAAVAPTAP